MWVIKNIIFAVFFIFITVFLSIIAIFLRFSQKYLVAIYKIWGKIILFLADKIYGIKYQIVGLENIKDEPCIVASKHQSMWETIIFLVLFDKISYILKSELLKIPFYGWHLKAMGMISVNRKGGLKAMRKMLEDAKQRLIDGYKIVIFPQGTRTPFNSSTQDYPYHFSFISLYHEGFKVIPASLDSGKFWPKGMFSKKKSGTITMTIMPAIVDNLNNIEFKKELQLKIEN